MLLEMEIEDPSEELTKEDEEIVFLEKTSSGNTPRIPFSRIPVRAFALVGIITLFLTLRNMGSETRFVRSAKDPTVNVTDFAESDGDAAGPMEDRITWADTNNSSEKPVFP